MKKILLIISILVLLTGCGITSTGKLTINNPLLEKDNTKCLKSENTDVLIPIFDEGGAVLNYAPIKNCVKWSEK